MFIKTTTHNRIVAEKDAEIAGLMKRLDASAERHKEDAERIKLVTGWYYAVSGANTKLHARLAPFTTPRARDDKGRFMKDTVA